MTRHALLIAAVLLLVACATYRLPGHPHSDGSVTNQVIYAYFAFAYETSGTPPAFSQFFLDQDDEVVFVLRLNHPGPAFTVAASLLRPDGSTARDFRDNVATTPMPGVSRTYYRNERYPMSELRAYPGAWTLRLLINGELAGVYGFRLDDSASVSRTR
jgi:hypothetical protein